MTKSSFFGVLTQGQTYLNLLYLLVSFPLGIIYFVLLVTGISLGLGLVITLLGIPILVGMLYAIWGLAFVDRHITMALLNIHIPIVHRKPVEGFIENIKAQFSDPFTWRGLLHLFLKFPMGIISFVFLVTFLCISLAITATPITYYLVSIQVLPLDAISINGINIIPSFGVAIFFGLLGLFLLFVTLHLLNGLAFLSGELARAILTMKEPPKKKKTKKKKRKK